VSAELKKPPLLVRVVHDTLGGLGAAALLYVGYRVMLHLVHRG
jgi:hypothetical protein